MPYGTLDVFVNFSRFCLAFLFVFVLVPRFLFNHFREADILEQFFANLTRMVFVVIVVGYFLVIIRLFEFISLAVVFTGIIFWQRFTKLPHDQRSGLINRVSKYFFDLAEGKICLATVLKAVLLKWVTGLLDMIRLRRRDARCRFELLLLLAVMGSAAYIRFYDSLVHLAPAMSDAYVTLAWMKYIERRELFYEGIYPHGFHIYLSVLHKFAATDPLFVLKFAGPLNSFLTTLGIYFAATRLTGRFPAGLAAAFIFGLLGKYLPNEYIRQASANSQEFGMVFVLPGVLFAAKYLLTGSRHHLFNTAAALAVTGLVHALAALFLACGLLAVAAAGSLSGLLSFKKFFNLVLAGIATAVISVLPALAGLAMGKDFHSSSAQFAQGAVTQQAAAIPEMSFFVLAALAGAAIYALFTFFRAGDKGLLLGGWAGILLTAGYTAVYQAPRFGVDNIALATRSKEFLSLVIPLGISLPFSMLARGPFERGRWYILATMLVVSAMVASLFHWPPVIPVPYKMQSEASMQQYVRINKEYRPTEWLMVSQEEGYGLVLGRSWHLMTGDFLVRFRPDEEKLVDKKGDSVLNIEHIFIFNEKNVFIPEYIKPEVLARRLAEEKELESWAKDYRRCHTNMEIYYEDDDLVVYAIHQIKSKRERFEEMWGGSGEKK